MKFKNKDSQQVLEVLSYDNGPKCYGFYQAKEFYLAFYISEKSDKQTWMHVELSKNDKMEYEQLKLGKIQLKDFLKDKSAVILDWDINNKQVSEKELSKIPDQYIPKYHLEQI